MNKYRVKSDILCERAGKEKFSQGGAKRRLKMLEERRQGRSGKPTIYECPFCNHLHIGNKKKRGYL